MSGRLVVLSGPWRVDGPVWPEAMPGASLYNALVQGGFGSIATDEAVEWLSKPEIEDLEADYISAVPPHLFFDDHEVVRPGVRQLPLLVWLGYELADGLNRLEKSVLGWSTDVFYRVEQIDLTAFYEKFLKGELTGSPGMVQRIHGQTRPRGPIRHVPPVELHGERHVVEIDISQDKGSSGVGPGGDD